MRFLRVKADSQDFYRYWKRFRHLPPCQQEAGNSLPFDSPGHYLLPTSWYYNSKLPRHCWLSMPLSSANVKAFLESLDPTLHSPLLHDLSLFTI